MSDHVSMEFGSKEDDSSSNYGIGIESPSPPMCCLSPDTFNWLAEFVPEIPGTGHVDHPSSSSSLPSSTFRQNVETSLGCFMDKSYNNGKAPAAPVGEPQGHLITKREPPLVSTKLFCFADGHVLDPQRVDLFYLDLSKSAYQVTIHRQNGFDSFSLTKVVDFSDLFQCLKVFLSSKVRLMFLIDEQYSLLTDELSLIGTGQPHLQMEAEFAFSLQNLMRSTMQYAISQASSSRKTNCQNVKSFIVCEFQNEFLLDQGADCRENGHKSLESFIPDRSSIKLSRVASVVYSLYLNGEVHGDVTILGYVFDIASSFSFSSVKFSYSKEHHSSPGHSQDDHFDGTLSLSLLVPSEASPVGFFEIIYCPQRDYKTFKGQRSLGNDKQKQHGLSPYLDPAVVPSSSNGRPMSLETVDGEANGSHESQEVIADSQTNTQNKRRKSSSIWTAAGFITVEVLKQHYGKKRKEAAENLQVSVSTFKRICRELGIPRWPSAKRKKDECNTAIQAGVSTTQSLPSALRSFSSSSSLIKAHEGSLLGSALAKQKEHNTSVNHNVLGKTEVYKRNNLPRGRALAELECLHKSQQYKPSNGNLSLIEVRTSHLPQNGAPYETVSLSRQKRKRKGKESDSIDDIDHLEEPTSEIRNCTSRRQAIESSWLNSISGTIEGINESHSPSSKSISDNTVDDTDTACMRVQPSVEPIQIQSLNSLPCNGNTPQKTKLLFNDLIALPLKDLINPEKETRMKETLCSLSENLSMFSDEQAKQIVELRWDFPTLVHSWREYSESQMYSQKFLDDLEKNTRSLETSAKDEESLNVRDEQLQSKEKELMAELEAVQKERAGIAEQRREMFEQTKHLVSLVEDNAGRRKEKQLVMTIASAKLNKLVHQWAAIQSLFMPTLPNPCCSITSFKPFPIKS